MARTGPGPHPLRAASSCEAAAARRLRMPRTPAADAGPERARRRRGRARRLRPATPAAARRTRGLAVPGNPGAAWPTAPRATARRTNQASHPRPIAITHSPIRTPAQQLPPILRADSCTQPRAGHRRAGTHPAAPARTSPTSGSEPVHQPCQLSPARYRQTAESALGGEADPAATRRQRTRPAKKLRCSRRKERKSSGHRAAQRKDERRSGPLGPPQAPGRIIESRRAPPPPSREGDDNAHAADR
jgi:hypothetical protein